MLLRNCKLRPQGLKPSFFTTQGGTAEAVPYPKADYDTSYPSLKNTVSCG